MAAGSRGTEPQNPGAPSCLLPENYSQAPGIQKGRKTRFGNLIRKTSLDELPQFINVFKGEMSIVGPRPHMVQQTQEYSELIEKYMLRHTIKPGITIFIF